MDPRRRGGLAGAFARGVQRRIPAADLSDRDPDYIRRSLSGLWLLSSFYFRADMRGLHHIPEREPVLLVGNHSGGNVPADTFVFALAFSAYFGADRPFYQLAHNLVMVWPGLGFLRRYGTFAATHSNAVRALDAGAAVLVYPGGDYETHRPVLGVGSSRLRPSHGVHLARAGARPPDRPRRVDRRSGDGPVSLAGRAAGFRPKRSQHDALQVLIDEAWDGGAVGRRVRHLQLVLGRSRTRG